MWTIGRIPSKETREAAKVQARRAPQVSDEEWGEIRAEAKSAAKAVREAGDRLLRVDDEELRKPMR